MTETLPGDTAGATDAALRSVRIGVPLLALASPAAAQTEEALRGRVRRQARDAADRHAGHVGRRRRAWRRRHALDYKEYGDRLKRYGVALHAGDSVTVTRGENEEGPRRVQLAGGGFGTFGDDNAEHVGLQIPDARKDRAREELEERIDDEHDRDRRRALQRELDDLRDRRERENRRIAAERERQSEAKRVRIAEQRLRGGSRSICATTIGCQGIRPQDLSLRRSPSSWTSA